MLEGIETRNGLALDRERAGAFLRVGAAGAEAAGAGRESGLLFILIRSTVEDGRRPPLTERGKEPGFFASLRMTRDRPRFVSALSAARPYSIP